MSEDFISQVEDELFPPKPGGAVDSARKAAAAAGSAHSMDTPSGEVSARYSAVRVLDESALVAQAGTVTVATGGSQAVMRVLAFDPNRKRAVIITLDQPVIVANSQAQANDSRNATNVAGQSAGGYVLSVNTPFVVQSAAEVWVAATSGTATRVSTWNETYSGQQ